MKSRLIFCLLIMFLVILFSASLTLADGPFIDNDNGTMTDSDTGLVWLKNANCKETVGGIAKPDGNLYWLEAKNWCSSLSSNSCGLSDDSRAGEWRLPSFDELKSLICGSTAPTWVYNGCVNNAPTLNGAYPYQWLMSQGFLNVATYYYWTSSINTDWIPGEENAWYVDMHIGYVDFTVPSLYYVWPVRGGYHVRVDGNPNVFYPSIQNAFDIVSDDSVVRLQEFTFTETLTLNQAVAVSLLGGYNADYSSQTGITTIKGTLTIAKGSLIISGVVIR